MPSFSSQLLLTTAASSSGLIPLADIDLIKGAFKVYPNLQTLQSESVTFFSDKQIVMTGNTGRLYQATVTLADFITVFEDSASFTEFSFTGLSADVPAGTISGSTQIAAFGYVLSSQTGSFAVKTQISGAFTEVSGGLAGRITTLEGTSGGSTDISALNAFTASAQSSLNALNSATSSYALKTEVSGAFTSVSSSISTRLTSLEAGGGSVPAGTISGSQQITDLGFINQSQTSSMSVATASYVDPTFISASAAAAGFGSGGGTTTDISALNTFTSSIQIQVDNLTAETSSYLTSADTSSFILASQTSSMSVLSAETASFISDTFISASAARSGFGISTLPSGVLSSSAQIAVEISGAFTEVSGGLAGRITTLEGTSGGDVSALNLFTGSIQTQVDNLTAETSSYLTSADTSSFITISQTSSMSVATASYIDPSFISASAAASGFGSGGGSTDISALNTFTGSAQTSLTALNAATSSYITNSQTSSMSVATASYVSPTFISASAAAAGFGSGGGSVPAGTVSSSAQTVANLVGQNVVVNTITAQQYVVSSSVSFITTSFSSGSTAFGDSLSDTHTFTGSVLITGSLNISGPFTVNNENLNVSSGSIILTNSSSIVVLDSGIISGTFVGNLNYNYITNLPNLISSSAQIAALGAGLLSSSAQIASDISGAFTSLSSSFASRIAALEAGSGGGSGIFALTGSFYSTTNNIQITGSLSVGSGSFKSFEVDSNGFVVLGDMTKDLNTAPVGTISYSGSNFYLIS